MEQCDIIKKKLFSLKNQYSKTQTLKLYLHNYLGHIVQSYVGPAIKTSRTKRGHILFVSWFSYQLYSGQLVCTVDLNPQLHLRQSHMSPLQGALVEFRTLLRKSCTWSRKMWQWELSKKYSCQHTVDSAKQPEHSFTFLYEDSRFPCLFPQLLKEWP